MANDRRASHLALHAVQFYGIMKRGGRYHCDLRVLAMQYYGVLQRGETVTTEDGRVIQPSQVGERPGSHLYPIENKDTILDSCWESLIHRQTYTQHRHLQTSIQG
eukprot:848003-Pelagomonas_calceolata.AAC.10